MRLVGSLRKTGPFWSASGGLAAKHWLPQAEIELKVKSQISGYHKTMIQLLSQD